MNATPITPEQVATPYWLLTHEITLRVTDGEFAAIQSAAKASGLTDEKAACSALRRGTRDLITERKTAVTAKPLPFNIVHEPQAPQNFQ